MQRSSLVVLGLVLCCCAAQASAHHSFAAQYDPQMPITFTGVVTKVEWLNPHARFYVDVKDDKGAVNTLW